MTRRPAMATVPERLRKQRDPEDDARAPGVGS